MRHQVLFLVGVFAGLILSAGVPLLAQDPVAVNPKIAQVVFENDRVRVLRVHYEPHQKFGMHEHPAKVAVCLTQFHTRRLAPDGTSAEGTFPAGAVAWREPEKHAVENLDDAAAETVEIELKYAHGPSVTAPAPAASTPPATSSVNTTAAEPMPVNLEPHHHVTFENQYVRLMNVVIEPGDITSFHTHSRDTVFVRLSDSLTQSQTLGESWGPTRPSKPGEVAFDGNLKKPLTHRVKNIGTTQYHVLVVELLP